MTPIQPIQMPAFPVTMPMVPITPISNPMAASQAAELGAGNFKDLLKGALNDLNASQLNSANAMKELATGEAKNLHEVVLAMEQAGLTLQYAIQIRNKILESYQEIVRMQV